MLAVWGTYIWRGLFLECYGILLQPLSDKFLLFSLKIRGLEVRSHRENRARNDTYFAISKRRYFLFAPPPPSLPPGQDRLKQFLIPGPEGLDLSQGLPGRMVTGQS